MDDYKEMYISLFKAVTNVIETLKAAQCKAEQMFIDRVEDKTAEKTEDSR